MKNDINNVVYGDSISKVVHYAQLIESLEDNIHEIQSDVLNLQTEVAVCLSHVLNLYKESGLDVPLVVGKSVYSLEDGCVVRRYLPDSP